jgi:hypothetical protein
VQRIEKRTIGRVAKAVEQVAGDASAVMTAKIDASKGRAEKIITATAQLEARRLWSVAAAMCLALLPLVAGYGLFASVRWGAKLVGTWKGEGMPKWPSWRVKGPRFPRASARQLASNSSRRWGCFIPHEPGL